MTNEFTRTNFFYYALGFFVGFFLYALAARAETLRIIQVPGLHAVSDEQVKEIYAKSSYYFRELGLTFRVKYATKKAGPCEKWHWLQYRGKELSCFNRHTSKRKKLITHWMTPPFISLEAPGEPQKAWLAGLAYSCGDVATGNALEANLETGEERLNHSAVTLAHEVGHLFCATHQDSSPNLLHSDAMRFVTEYGGILPVLEATKRQVRRALR